MANTNTIRLGRNSLDAKQWAVKASKLLAVNEMSFTDNPNRLSPVEFDVVRATTATRVNELGLIESVAANVPRIDFQNDWRGELLVEPQRSNYIQFGNLLTGWTAQAGASITTGRTDMMGGTNAVRLQSDGTAAIFRDIDDLGFPDSVEGTISCWVKATSSTSEPFRFVADGTQNSPNLTATNEWQKFSFTFTNGVGPNNSGFIYDTLGNPFDIIIFLPQMEVGAYPTSSIINYTNGLVTRNADVMSASGLGNVLGQSEGTLFVEAIAFSSTDSPSFSFADISGSFTNRIAYRFLGSGNRASVFLNTTAGNGVAFDSPAGSIFSNIYYKTAFRYAPNDFTFYANGSSLGTDIDLSTFSGQLVDFKFAFQNGASPFYGRIRNIQNYDVGLTNVELAEITTPITEILRRPRISGDAFVGDTLTAEAGTWSTGSDVPVTSSYVWQTSTDGIVWSDIIGTTDAATYTIVAGDENNYIRIFQTVTDGTTTDSLGSFSSSQVTLPVSFIDTFGQPAIGLSLRDLLGTDPDVVRVRRDSDDAEADFKASEVSDGTLENWVNEAQTLFDENFASSTGWTLRSGITISGGNLNLLNVTNSAEAAYKSFGAIPFQKVLSLIHI